MIELGLIDTWFLFNLWDVFRTFSTFLYLVVSKRYLKPNIWFGFIFTSLDVLKRYLENLVSVMAVSKLYLELSFVSYLHPCFFSNSELECIYSMFGRIFTLSAVLKDV